MHGLDKKIFFCYYLRFCGTLSYVLKVFTLLQFAIAKLKFTLRPPNK